MIITSCENRTSNKTLDSKNEMPLKINPEAAVDGIIYFDILLNVKLYRRATKKLEDKLYDCVPHNLFNFLEFLNDWATEFQSSDNVVNMMIMKKKLDMNMDYINVLTNKSENILNMITKFEEKYIGKESRAAQDTNVLYQCLMNSPSKVGKDKVSARNSQYKVNGLPSGNMLLKVIIREIHLDTNVTTKSIRMPIGSLYAYIRKIICDITKFNVHVKLLLA